MALILPVLFIVSFSWELNQRRSTIAIGPPTFSPSSIQQNRSSFVLCVAVRNPKERDNQEEDDHRSCRRRPQRHDGVRRRRRKRQRQSLGPPRSENHPPELHSPYVIW